jgi:hypothetical protein
MTNNRRLPARQVGHRFALALGACMLLAMLVLLPFALSSVLTDLVDPQPHRVFSILGAGEARDPIHSDLHVDLLDLDDRSQTVTIRVSGHHACPPPCTWATRFLFVASAENGSEAEGLPPSQSITLPPTNAVVTQEFALPVAGDSLRFPFDQYRLNLGIVIQRIYPDGRVETRTPEQVRGLAFLTLQTHVSRLRMSPPRPTTAEIAGLSADEYLYADVTAVAFTRPLYIKVQTVLLVLLIAAAAGYAVFLRPLDQLLINTGALILGVWGVRAVLLGATTPPGGSAIDLSLSVVVLFLLTAILVRALRYHQLNGGVELHLTGRARTTSLAADDPTVQDSESAVAGSAAEHSPTAP